MTLKQRELLERWCFNLLAAYRVDFFRGNALLSTVHAINRRTRSNIDRAKCDTYDAINYGFEVSPKDNTELIKELQQIAKEVPLSDAAQCAITHVFCGNWAEAIEAIDKLKTERNEQN